MTKNDPVYKMLQGLVIECERPRTFSGREAWLSGRTRLNQLGMYARDLISELQQGTMDDKTYKALSDGSHPLYRHATELGMEIKPTKPERS